MTGTQRRHRAWRYGRLAETLCVWRLRLAGYRILGRDLRTRVGELDIVVSKGRLVAFVEVKARRNLNDAAEALGLRQRRRIERAAGAFLAERPDLGGLDMRFDVMLVGRRRFPVHLKDAWRPER